MAAASNLQVRENDLGVLDADDVRVPEDIRASFARYGKTVATVVPVISMSRAEWWLFDADGALIDMLSRRVDVAASGVRDSAVHNIVRRVIQADRP